MATTKIELEGLIKKMVTENTKPVSYRLPIGGELLALNAVLGNKIKLEFLKQIICQACGRKIKKSFNQGYCYQCFISLAKCDRCQTNPELCHYYKGTCREPRWGEKHCLIEHTIYIANSSNLKIGITRKHQQETRWMDQGAVQAMPIGKVRDRLDSGKIESILKKHLADRTNWRKMLNHTPSIDLDKKRIEILKKWPHNIDGAFKESSKLFTFEYPVLQYPQKITSHNLDKNPVLEGILTGIKGQYLIFKHSVINIRKYSGYKLNIKVG